MSNHQAPYPSERGKHPINKLQKRKKRLQERLQDARDSRSQAEKRVIRARSRLQRKEQRVSRLETRLSDLLTTLETMPSDTHSSAACSAVAEDGFPTPDQRGSLSSPSTDLILRALEVVRDAYAVAVFAERVAQTTVTREIEIEKHLDHIVTARHLLPEIMQVQVASDHSRTFALEAERAAKFAQQLFLLLHAEKTVNLPPVADQPYALSSTLKSLLLESLFFSDEDDIVEILADEKMLERVASMLIADTAAEAFTASDASLVIHSEHAQKARLLAHQSDKMLSIVRSFIEEGLLVGVIAERALSITEDEVLHAHALVKMVDAQVLHASSLAADTEAEVTIAVSIAVDQCLGPEVSDPGLLEE